MCTKKRSSPYTLGSSSGSLTTGTMPLPSLPGAFGDELLDPEAETRDFRRCRQRKLVPSFQRQRTQRGAEPAAGVVPHARACLAAGGHLGDAVQQLPAVHAAERGGHEPEERADRVPPTEVRRVLEYAPEPLRGAALRERCAGVRDCDEMPSGPLRAHGTLHDVPKVLVERVRFYGAAGLRRDDEQRTRRVDGARYGAHPLGDSGVEHGESREARGAADALPQHLRPEAAAAHAEQHHVTDALAAHLFRKRMQVAYVLCHVAGDREPAEPVGDLRGGVIPDRVVLIPDTGHDIVAGQLRQRSGDVLLGADRGGTWGGCVRCVMTLAGLLVLYQGAGAV